VVGAGRAGPLWARRRLCGAAGARGGVAVQQLWTGTRDASARDVEPAAPWTAGAAAEREWSRATAVAAGAATKIGAIERATVQATSD
jgi:hypothetical protein